MVRVKEYGEPWIILDYAGCGGLAYFIHVEDDWPDVNALGLLTPARNSSYQHPVIEGKLDENGYAKVSIPIELAAHPLNIVVYPSPDWSSVWFNVSSGLQIIGGVSSIALACSATLLTGGAATVLSLGLAAWGADQLMTGVNSLVQQQPHKTLMAQGLEQLGTSETYSETLTDMVGFTNATALANLLVKNSAKLGLSTISISLTERKQQVLLNYISLKTTKLNRKFSLRREQLGNIQKIDIVKEGRIIQKGYTVEASKFDYFFGRVTTGNPHNIARSIQNFKDLNKLGVTNKEELIIFFNKAIKDGVITSKKTNDFGTTITKSIIISEKGAIQVAFFYTNSDFNAVPKITTLIPKLFVR